MLQKLQVGPHDGGMRLQVPGGYWTRMQHFRVYEFGDDEAFSADAHGRYNEGQSCHCQHLCQQAQVIKKSA